MTELTHQPSFFSLMVHLVNCEMFQEVLFNLKVVATKAALIILWPMYTIFMWLQIGCWSKIPITYRALPFCLMQMLIFVVQNSPIMGTETFWTFRTKFTIYWNRHLSTFFSLNVNTMCICSHVLKNLKGLSLQIGMGSVTSRPIRSDPQLHWDLEGFGHRTRRYSLRKSAFSSH